MRILSGIQPTGQLHLGNYLGMVQNALALQARNDCFYAIVDLHALTAVHDAKEFRENVHGLMRAMLALGFDPKRSVLFVQSHVPQHTELAWILQTLAPLGELERMTQFKDKAEQNKANVNSGLLTYPVLMASDILLYRTQGVPVGQDQLQHLELARTLARKFNSTYGKTFIEPKALLVKNAARVMSLQDPAKKMSKSLGPQHYVGLFEDEEEIRAKIMRAVTDSGREVRYDMAEKLALSNLLTIYSALSRISIPQLEKKYAGKGYAQFKQDLADVIIDLLRPAQKRYRMLKDSAVQKIFLQGAKRAQKEAKNMMKVVRTHVGLQ